METELTVAHAAFGSEIRRLRVMAGLSQETLAKRLHCSASYISKMESGKVPPTADFARIADNALRAGGDILDRWKAWLEVGERRIGRPRSSAAVADGDAPAEASGSQSMNVKYERTTLIYEPGLYYVSVIRELLNATRRPINGYEVRVHVDAFPDDVERSREFYRVRPLRWEELGFRCWYARRVSDLDPRGEQVSSAIELLADPTQTITDKMIEGWIRFEGKNYGETLTLHPGQRIAIMYKYQVDDEQWGRWYQRRMRLPTGQLDVELDFPKVLRPFVWGKAVTAGGRLGPLSSPIGERILDGRSIWSWSIVNPDLGDRFRFEWRFDSPGMSQKVG